MERPFDGFLVTEELTNVHKIPKVSLIEGDLIVKEKPDDGTWKLLCPGIGFFGFKLTTEQEATLKPIKYGHDGELGFSYDREP